MGRSALALALCLWGGAGGSLAQNISGGLENRLRPAGEASRVTLQDFSESGPEAGGTMESAVRVEARTRKEAVKDVLRDLLRAYVQQDLFHFFEVFAPEALQGAGIVRQAVQNDFKTETNINVDVELLEYRQEFRSVCLRFIWNRVATRVDTGVPVVQRGNSQFCFDRDEDFRVNRIVGAPPFGLTDPEFLNQVRAGQTEPATQSVIRTLSLGAGGHYVDLDTGQVTPVSPLGSTITPPGADFGYFEIMGESLYPLRTGLGSSSQAAGPSNISGTLPQIDGGGTNYFLEGLNGAVVQICSPEFQQMNQIGRMETGFVGRFNGGPYQPGQPGFMGVVTSQGQYALVELNLPDTIRYQLFSTPEFYPGVDTVCIQGE